MPQFPYQRGDISQLELCLTLSCNPSIQDSRKSQFARKLGHEWVRSKARRFCSGLILNFYSNYQVRFPSPGKSSFLPFGHVLSCVCVLTQDWKRSGRTVTHRPQRSRDSTPHDKQKDPYSPRPPFSKVFTEEQFSSAEVIRLIFFFLLETRFKTY